MQSAMVYMVHSDVHMHVYMYPSLCVTTGRLAVDVELGGAGGVVLVCETMRVCTV